MADKFAEALSIEEEIGRRARLDDAPPMGFLPDGKLNVVKADDPPYQPEVEEADDLSDLDEIPDDLEK